MTHLNTLHGDSDKLHEGGADDNKVSKIQSKWKSTINGEEYEGGITDDDKF